MVVATECTHVAFLEDACIYGVTAAEFLPFELYGSLTERSRDEGLAKRVQMLEKAIGTVSDSS